MLFSFLIASVSAAAGSPINDCEEYGAVPHQYVVTLQESPPAMSSGVHSSLQSLETQDTASYIQDWLRRYNPEYSSNGAGRRKLGANADSPLVLHVFTAIEPAVAINASNETIALMEKDPAVKSIECDCAQTTLATYPGAPWGLDRIDGVDDNSYDDGDLTGGGTGVRVYVVDTGVQGSHVDFGGRVVSGHTARARPECASCQAVNGILPADGTGCNNHGTHVASTVGGLDHGVAKKVTLVPASICFSLQCSDGRYKCGSGSDIRASLEWVLTDCAAHPEARCAATQATHSVGTLIAPLWALSTLG